MSRPPDCNHYVGSTTCDDGICHDTHRPYECPVAINLGPDWRRALVQLNDVLTNLDRTHGPTGDGGIINELRALAGDVVGGLTVEATS